MSKVPSVFVHPKCFIVLDDLIGGRVTGEKQDTVTVFYKGGDSVYFHIGAGAADVLRDIIEELKSTGTHEADPDMCKEYNEDQKQQ